MIDVHKIESKVDLERAFSIREEVFVIEQGVDREEEYDQFETTSTHFLAIENEMPVGTARWRIKDDKIKLERFAVLKESRGRGVGASLVNAVLQDIKKTGQKRGIYMHAQVQAVPFYEKLGFKKQGDMFFECEIEHYIMVR